MNIHEEIQIARNRGEEAVAQYLEKRRDENWWYVAFQDHVWVSLVDVLTVFHKGDEHLAKQTARRWTTGKKPLMAEYKGWVGEFSEAQGRGRKPTAYLFPSLLAFLDEKLELTNEEREEIVSWVRSQESRKASHRVKYEIVFSEGDQMPARNFSGESKYSFWIHPI